MAYVLTLIALLTAFLWATPAHTVIVDNLRSAAHTVQSTIASSSDPFTAQIQGAAASVREKAMELLRKELHRSVDSLVK